MLGIRVFYKSFMTYKMHINYFNGYKSFLQQFIAIKNTNFLSIRHFAIKYKTFYKSYMQYYIDIF